MDCRNVCDGCKTILSKEIGTERYRCTRCETYILCRSCFDKNIHQDIHPSGWMKGVLKPILYSECDDIDKPESVDKEDM